MGPFCSMSTEKLIVAPPRKKRKINVSRAQEDEEEGEGRGGGRVGREKKKEETRRRGRKNSEEAMLKGDWDPERNRHIKTKTTVVPGAAVNFKTCDHRAVRSRSNAQTPRLAKPLLGGRTQRGVTGPPNATKCNQNGTQGPKEPRASP